MVAHQPSLPSSSLPVLFFQVLSIQRLYIFIVPNILWATSRALSRSPVRSSLFPAQTSSPSFLHAPCTIYTKTFTTIHFGNIEGCFLAGHALWNHLLDFVPSYLASLARSTSKVSKAGSWRVYHMERRSLNCIKGWNNHSAAIRTRPKVHRVGMHELRDSVCENLAGDWDSEVFLVWSTLLPGPVH